MITVYDPFAAVDRIRKAYIKIMESFQTAGLCEEPKEGILTCFEHVYVKEGITCMDVYIHVDSMSKADSFTNFS